MIEMINGITVTGIASDSDEVVGGIGIYFQIHMTNGEVKVISIGANGKLLRYSSNVRYKIKAIDENELWESLDYEEIEVGEDGLPRIPS